MKRHRGGADDAWEMREIFKIWRENDPMWIMSWPHCEFAEYTELEARTTCLHGACGGTNTVLTEFDKLIYVSVVMVLSLHSCQQ